MQVNERKAVITFLILLGTWLFSALMHVISTEATIALIEAGQERTFQEVFYNFIIYYVCCSMLSLAAFHFISIFHVKYLTRPLQYTCAIAIAIQCVGALGYIGLWNEAFYTQCINITSNHYNALIAVTVFQLMLFVSFWIDNYVEYIDRCRDVGWATYNRCMSSYVYIKSK